MIRRELTRTILCATLVLVGLLLTHPIANADPTPTITPDRSLTVTATATPSPGFLFGGNPLPPSGSETPAGRDAQMVGTATASGSPSISPTRRPTRILNADLNRLRALLPTTVPTTPQPSAFFVPRLITVTLGLDDSTGSRLQGRVLDWRGNGMVGVAVRAVSERDDRSVLTRTDGTYLFDNQSSGNYAVSVAGYEGVPAAPLPVDGQSIFIVEFVEGSRPITPTATATPTAVQGRTSPTPAGRLGPSSTPTISSARTTPFTTTSSLARGTATPKPEPQWLSSDDRDYLSRTLLTPFLLGAAGGYVVFLLGIFGARLRR